VKSAQPAPFTLRKHLALPIAGLIACSLVTISLVHLDLGLSSAVVAWIVTALAGGTILAGFAVIVFTTRSVARPMAHLVEIARAITNGRARQRASPEKAGDFRVLADAFNRMIEARQDAEERLQRSNESLELKVQARTVELYRSNKALREESAQREIAEREFQQAQKMDALGKLAGSIAHDFNNLLTVIIGGAECAQKQIPKDHPAQSFLHTVRQAGERAAGLTRPLLTFSRSQALAVEALSLNEAAEEASQMLARLLGVNIEMRMQLDPELRMVKANGNQLQQLLVNLGVNARDAMEGLGVLTITTRNATVDPAALERHQLPPSEYWVEVSVSDTGCGMDEVTKARIFEPFFTTKPAGKGTGLGLATVFGIVKQTGGFMEVDSALGEGTTFRVFMPGLAASEVPVPVTAEATAEPTAAQTSGDETLLLVDDEDDIRELATLTLESLGYRVLSASNAEEAIVLGEKHAGEIRALVTDVAMPGISGVQLAEVLLKVIPDLKVLFVSGYNNETISSDALNAAHADYLQKPYRSDALAQKIREVLSDSRPRLARISPEDQLAA
jgi:signal transduction histidine kinase/ActR/RegA family two-component response regulator